MLLSSPVILIYSIVAAAALIYAPFLIVVYARFLIGYNISAPRAMFDKLPAYAQRATWAHENSLEVFMVFTASALTAYITAADNPLVGLAAITFVITRFLYSAFYILNLPMLRSLMFGIGSLGTVTLFALSIMKITH
ncbi:hypothetical protein RINTHM_6670 [Richelia intracellularis HM01]|uniref:MAPEG family protein n=1 Tax=Richelia intracellularis TaxID=1164990 RepID=UPI0002B5A579|nr:MAPEG family protein [Richelia intracellularis]CCH65133.1 hypothetical protein RINTHM_6670 [Richelia intracellularis HM01]